jgi:hypothetical protein
VIVVAVAAGVGSVTSPPPSSPQLLRRTIVPQSSIGVIARDKENGPREIIRELLWLAGTQDFGVTGDL